MEGRSHSSSHPLPCLDNLSEDENKIKNDFKGNKISLISWISIYLLVGVFRFLSTIYF